ncbi:MAG: lipoate--protein ligase [Clostridia bacterium]
MKLIVNKNTSPYFNLACEEYLLKSQNDSCVMLWRNEKSVIVGRNQNTILEINKSYCDTNNIKVVRRLSGGGAVFHDMGNVNYTLISKRKKENVTSFKDNSLAVIDFLKSQYNISALNEGRNDIKIEGNKICGMAECVFEDRLLFHCCILFNGSIKDLALALKPKKIKAKTFAVKSVKAKVKNIASFVENVSTADFFDSFVEYLLKINNLEKPYYLSDKEIAEIEKLAEEKYKKDSWNYNENVKFNYKNSVKLQNGIVEISLSLKDDVIEKACISGDFFGTSDISQIETSLVGVKFDAQKIAKTLSKFNISNYITSATINDILSLF